MTNLISKLNLISAAFSPAPGSQSHGRTGLHKPKCSTPPDYGADAAVDVPWTLLVFSQRRLSSLFFTVEESEPRLCEGQATIIVVHASLAAWGLIVGSVAAFHFPKKNTRSIRPDFLDTRRERDVPLTARDSGTTAHSSRREVS